MLNNMTPHALLNTVDALLHQAASHKAVAQGDKATCVLLGLQVRDLCRKYASKPAQVPLGQQYAMLAGAPEAEQDALLGQAG